MSMTPLTARQQEVYEWIVGYFVDHLVDLVHQLNRGLYVLHRRVSGQTTDQPQSLALR